MDRTIFKRVKILYNSLPLPMKLTFWFCLCNIMQNGISYITLPIFTRLLSPQEYGQVTVFNSWKRIIAIFLTLNLSSGVFMTAYVKFKENRNQVISSFQGLTTVLVLSFGGIYFVLQHLNILVLEITPVFMLVIGVECLLESSFSLWSMKQKFLYKYKLFLFITILSTILNPLVGILWVTSTSHKVFARILSGVVVESVIYGGIYFYNFWKGKCFFSLDYWKYALCFGVPLLPHYLSLIVLGQSDRLMIAKMCSESKAGIYGVGYSVASLISLLFGGINTSFGPWIMQKIDDRDYNNIKKRTREILQFILLVTISILLIQPELIKLATPIEYHDVIKIMPSITIGLFFSYLNNVFARVEFYYEKKYYITFFSCISSFLNILLNYIFISIFDYYAAGYTTLISYIVLCFLHYCVYRSISKRYMDGARIYDEKSIISMSLLLLIFGIICNFLSSYILLRYSILVILLLFICYNRDYIARTLNGENNKTV